jgi:ADP-ribosylglycohydrolase
MTPSQADRIRGALLGLAWGDVFGCPVEGWRAAQIERVYGRYDRLPEEYPLARIAPLGKKALKHLRPLGLHSDDTQQALALVHVCLTGWSPEAWAEGLLEGQRRGAWRGYGRNFAGALARLTKGDPPRRAGGTTAGVGATMRIGPLGALFWDDPEHLGRAVMESSLVTHGDVRAGAFAYAVSRAAAALVAGQGPSQVRAELPGRVAEREAEWLAGHADWAIDRTAGHLISRCLTEFFAGPLTPPEQVRQRISELARPHLADGFTRAHPNQGFVLLGGLHGLAAGLAEPADPARILSEIVAQGYDTDTVAAISGSLLGARLGCDWIPRNRLLDRERLEAYAESLVRRQGGPEGREEFLRREADWTRREAEYQAALSSAF